LKFIGTPTAKWEWEMVMQKDLRVRWILLAVALLGAMLMVVGMLIDSHSGDESAALKQAAKQLQPSAMTQALPQVDSVPAIAPTKIKKKSKVRAKPKDDALSLSRKRDIPPGNLRQQIASYKTELRSCYERSLHGYRDRGSAKMNLELTVTESGRVAGVNTSGGTPKLKSCVQRKARGWQFSEQHATLRLRVPVSFVPIES